MVWISLEGLPLIAWTPIAFKKIASNWGEPIFVDEDPTESLSIGRVCIQTSIRSNISEVCKVSINNSSYNIRVKEFAGRVPDFEAIDLSSNKDSDSDESENGSDMNNINCNNSIHDDEEGEIRENDVNTEGEVKV
ncbi:RNA-directed DNA polymerase, eukaryota [Tanacetum coccineum]|uniref:RNA-directed DNA polymerase, eukaryota n=1 Tax=Tanacetum coccineum TaxID=301880 RepID=A0ABQ5BJL3_9ASTR